MDYELKMVKKDLTAAFINFFARTIGPYRDFLKNGQFDQSAFVKAQPENLQPVSFIHY